MVALELYEHRKISAECHMHFSGVLSVLLVALHLSPKNVSTANTRCPTDQRCMMTERFKPRDVCFTAPPTQMSAWR
jgi:hypothetical protein